MNSILASQKALLTLLTIRVSNVDQKTQPGEKPVKLCNYMDVYSNEYVTSGARSSWRRLRPQRKSSVSA